MTADESVYRHTLMLQLELRFNQPVTESTGVGEQGLPFIPRIFLFCFVLL